MKLYFFLISINAAFVAIICFVFSVINYDKSNYVDAAILFMYFVAAAFAAKVFCDAYLEANDDAKAADKTPDA